MKHRVNAIAENETGRNIRFQDSNTGETMTRAQFVRQIENGKYGNYHVRVINGVKTPASNPDKSSRNNLG